MDLNHFLFHGSKKRKLEVPIVILSRKQKPTKLRNGTE